MGVNLVGLTPFGTMEHPHVLKIISRRVDVVDEVESKQSRLCSGDHLMFPCERTSVAANAELATVRRYVENTAECRRVQLKGPVEKGDNRF